MGEKRRGTRRGSGAFVLSFFFVVSYGGRAEWNENTFCPCFFFFAKGNTTDA
jgi:hypothetical protein